MALELAFTHVVKQRPITKNEINDLAIAAQAARDIARVMAEFAGDCSGDGESLGIFISMFTVLEWLTEPIVNYLDEYAGDPAATEEADHD